jgi:hypothetical protein
VSVEAVSRASCFPTLQSLMGRLPPKLVDIGEPMEPSDEREPAARRGTLCKVASWVDMPIQRRIESTREHIRAGHFSSRHQDKEMVLKMLDE